MKRSVKTYNASRSEFKAWTTDLSTAMAAAARFYPEENESKETLRKNMNAIYTRIACALSTEHCEVVPDQVFGLSIQEFEFTNGRFVIHFSVSQNSVNKNYSFVVINHMAPYKTNWANLLQQHGGANASRTATILEMI